MKAVRRIVLFEMEEIIKIEERNGQQAINARELHHFLENKRKFTDWIKQRIEQYGFVENQDFCSFHKIVKRETGATTITEYALTIDMAKELCMVENNEKGRIARRYFIECEKLVNVHRASYQISDPIKRAEAWIEEEKERQRLLLENQQKEQLLIEQQPKVVLADAVTASEDDFPIKDLATILAQNGIKIGPIRLRRFLIENHYLGTKGECYMKPRHQYIEQGLFKLIETLEYNDYTKRDEANTTVMVTGKGLKYFINKFLNNKNE